MIHIVLPTLNREAKLFKCLGSIGEAKKRIDENIFVFIYFTEEKEFESISKKLLGYYWILTRLIKEYNASEFWNNHFRDSNADAYFYINDDVVLAPDCLKNALDSMTNYFPDSDGVVGLYQENIPDNQQCQTAFGCIGSTFVDRFPERQVFMPKYKRFYCDTELYNYTSKIGKHYFDKTSKLIHLHPAFNKEWEDTTHHLVRKYLNKDRKLYEQRISKGLLWGENFEV
jgi:GT2 family glycosyltransferase